MKPKEKSARFYLRLSDEDKRQVQAKAQRAGLSLSEFCRRSLASSEVRVLSKDEIRTINGLSNNFNQMMRNWNTFGGEAPRGLTDELEKIIRELKRLYQE